MINENINSQSESPRLELKHLKWQMTELHYVLLINIMLLCYCEEANIVIVIVIFMVIVLGVNGPSHLPIVHRNALVLVFNTYFLVCTRTTKSLSLEM